MFGKQDKLFENATYDDWGIVTRPRVQGAWNLDALLPKDMDFFVALGSFLGDTGNGGQAIYAGTAVSLHPVSLTILSLSSCGLSRINHYRGGPRHSTTPSPSTAWPRASTR